MRLDKYLKVSRLIKRRSVASDAAKTKKIVVNGKIAKPSLQLKVNDIIEIHYYDKVITVLVKALLDSTKKDDAQMMYEVQRIDNKAVE